MVLATVTGTEVIQGFSMLDVKNITVPKGIEESIDVTLVASTPLSPVDEHEEVEQDTIADLDSVTTSDTDPEVLPFVPTIRSGSFADIGPHRCVEDEHICIDDLSSHMGSPFTGTEVIQGFSMLDVKNITVSKGIEEIIDVTLAASTPFSPMDEHKEVEEDTIADLDSGDSVTTSDTEPEVLPFVPTIRSGSFADIGPHRCMEDEHICIDDLSSHTGSPFTGTEAIQGFSMLDVKNITVSKGIEEIIDVTLVASTPFSPVDEHKEVVEDTIADLDLGDSVTTSDTEPEVLPFVPTIRSGSFADIGPRRYMEDEHICIDDLSSHMGTHFTFPTPSAFYGVFDGHGGPDAAAYVKRHAMRFFFEESVFPQASDADNVFIESVESSVRTAFSLADHALADDCTISSSSGTTALAAWVFGRLLLIANAGDCRAVLCRNGKAINMSHDHRPIYPSERHRIESSGGYIEDGYLNGALSVSRALGDWDMKLPRGSSSPLISEPEFTQTVLTEEDEFLIIGCDGIWDVMTSQHAVSIVRRGLRRHDNPEQCARELVREALRMNTFDNLTVVVVCFTRDVRDERREKEVKLRCCSLSAEALCNLKSWLNN